MTSRYENLFAVRSRRFGFRSILLWVAMAWVVAVFARGQSIHAQQPEASGASHVSATTFLVVRHAERDGELDALTQAGRERADLLKELGMSLRVSAIYSTDFERTKETVRPLAEACNVEVRLYSVATPEWLNQLGDDHPGEVVLIVGHSNTVGEIAGRLGGKSVAEIGQDEYDKLFVAYEKGDRRSLIRLRFGDSTRVSPAAAPDQMGPLKGR
jgi:phosphohistidine phosphatase SixA